MKNFSPTINSRIVFIAGMAIVAVVIGSFAMQPAGRAAACGTSASCGCVMQIVKSVDKASAHPGDTLTYTLNFSNIGTADCTGGGVRVNDVLSPDLTFVSETHSANIDAGYNGTPTYEAGTRTIWWNAQTLNPGESGSATVKATVNSSAALTCTSPIDVANTAKITSFEYGNFSQWVTSNAVHTSASKDCPVPVSADIKANNSDGPVTIDNNTSANLSWNSANATACTVTPGSYTGTNGSHATGNLTQSATFTVTCTGTGGTATDSVTVNVRSVPAPVITADIKANGSDTSVTIDYNAEATLTWSSVNAQSCTVTPGSFTGLSGSHTTGKLTGAVTYMLVCNGTSGTATDSVVVNVRTAQGPTVDIKANGSDGPVTIDFNGTATLTWASQNATACTVTPGNYTGISGSKVTDKLTEASRTYTVTCTGPGGTATDSVTINDNPPVLSADIKANSSDGPVANDYNTTVSLTWTSSNADTCTVSPGGWTGKTGTQVTGKLIDTRTYTLTCAGSGQTVTDSVTIVVLPQTTPSVTITANPSYINKGDSSVLTWSSSNATHCYGAGGWSGTKELNGSLNVSPSLTTTYVMVCTNDAGQTATSQTTVTVSNTSTQSPTLTLYSTPTVINQGQSATLIWNSQNTVSCTANQGNWSGSKSLNGSEIIYPPYTTTYGMSCVGTNGQTVNQQATIVVNNQGGGSYSQQPTVTLYVNPTNINSGQSVTLNWYSSNANTCTASGGNWSGNKSLTGSEVVYPSYTQSYIITCYNNYGTAMDSKTVVVGNSYNYNYNNNSQSNLTVTKNVRNITLNQSSYTNSVETEGLDVLEFEVRVRNNDYNNNNYYTNNQVTVRDVLPAELFYVSGSTSLDGSAVADGIVSGGVSLGTVSPGQERVVLFRATVYYGTAQKSITNQVTASTLSGAVQNAYATITIKNRGAVLGAADVTTGPEDAIPWALGLGLVTALGIQFFVFNKKGMSGRMFLSGFMPTAHGDPEAEASSRTEISSTHENSETKSHRARLDAMLADLRTREERPDTEQMFQK